MTSNWHSPEDPRPPSSSHFTVFAVLTGLALFAALGWPFLVVYVIFVGPALGVQHALSPYKEKVASDA